VGPAGPHGVLRPARPRPVGRSVARHVHRRAARPTPGDRARRDRPAWAEGVSRSPLGEVLKNPALQAARFAVRYAPKTVHRTRGAAKSVIAPILRAASYGDEKISPSVVAFSEKMMHDTPIATLVEFLHALEVHDEIAALPTLAKVPTLIACGDRDLLTPMEHSQSIAAALPKSELIIVGGAGHLVQLEQPEAIDDALVRLVERATPSKLVALTRRVRERVRNHG